MTDPLRTMSYGGGVQSTACLVLAVQGKIDFPVFLFANVGDDSEDPATLEYVDAVARPFAKSNGIELHILRRQRRGGELETLWGRLTKPGSRSIPIPIRMSRNGPPASRSCTSDFKMRVIYKWQRQHGATKRVPAVSGLGISLDEAHRMRRDSGFPAQVLEYPLLELRIRRDECKTIIGDAGLPVPDPSACFFCPFHSIKTWATMANERPGLFQRSVDLERLLNERRRAAGRDLVYFTRFAIPLDEITEQYANQLTFDFSGIDACDSGHCWT